MKKAQRIVPDFDPRYSISTVAEFLDITPKSVRRMIRQGRLQAHQDGTRFYIMDSVLRAYIAKRPKTGKARE